MLIKCAGIKSNSRLSQTSNVSSGARFISRAGSRSGFGFGHCGLTSDWQAAAAGVDRAAVSRSEDQSHVGQPFLIGRRHLGQIIDSFEATAILLAYLANGSEYVVEIAHRSRQSVLDYVY